MRSLMLYRFLTGCYLLLAVGQQVSGQVNRQIFVASTPCDNVSVRDFFDIKDFDCEQIRWIISLHAEANPPEAAKYEVRIRYGMALPNTNDLVGRGREVIRTGNYRILHGFNGNGNAVVYELETKDSKTKMRYLKVNDQLLHLIGPGNELAIGNGGWSYTMNNISKNTVSYASSNATTTNTETVDGVFVGRTPCKEIAAQLKKEASPDCFKLKWKIKFDKATTTYKIDGTFFRSQPRVGKFVISQGINGNPKAIVIQLDPDKPSESLYFLKGDDNVLFFLNTDKKCFVGNDDFSFTLNRETLQNQN